MGERRYLLADVAKRLEIPPYMLRYYEDALAISIPRNERGLRYYGRSEVELFKSVLNLEKKGFNLGEIKIIMDDIHRVEKLPPDKLLELRDRLDGCMEKCRGGSLVKPEERNTSLPAETPVSTGAVTDSDDKMMQFKRIMTEIMLDALKINNEDLSQQINYTVTDSITREMNYLINRKERAEEERFKQLDRRLREVCAVKEGKKKNGAAHQG